jgi:hypothetical protein
VHEHGHTYGPLVAWPKYGAWGGACLAGTTELLADLQKDAALTANARAKQGLDDMAILLDYLSVFNVLGHVRPRSPAPTCP